MPEVFLHVYDVANGPSLRTNGAILQLNKLLKDGIGLGGIFHTAVEVYDKEEWSFGYCETGSGVFSCPRMTNPMYIFRESLSLGHTSLRPSEVKEILTELSREWPGFSYGLLSRNCNHFCDEFCERLEVQRLPAWVNRFANAGETAVEVAETTMKCVKLVKNEVVSASKVAYQALFGGTSALTVRPDPELLDDHGNGRNFLQLRSVNSFSRNCVGALIQSVNEREHTKRAVNE